MFSLTTLTHIRVRTARNGGFTRIPTVCEEQTAQTFLEVEEMYVLLTIGWIESRKLVDVLAESPVTYFVRSTGHM